MQMDPINVTEVSKWRETRNINKKYPLNFQTFTKHPSITSIWPLNHSATGQTQAPCLGGTRFVARLLSHWREPIGCCESWRLQTRKRPFLQCACLYFSPTPALSQHCKKDSHLNPVANLSQLLIRATRNQNIFNKELLDILASFAKMKGGTTWKAI